MKKSGIIIVMIGCLAVFTLVSLSNTIAYHRRSTDPDIIQYNQAMRTGMQAFHRQDYTTARIYLQRAVQVKPESEEAWDRFEKAVRMDQVERIQALSPGRYNERLLRAGINGNLCPCTEPISNNYHPPVKPEDVPVVEDGGC